MSNYTEERAVVTQKLDRAGEKASSICQGSVYHLVRYSFHFISAVL